MVDRRSSSCSGGLVCLSVRHPHRHAFEKIGDAIPEPWIDHDCDDMTSIFQPIPHIRGPSPADGSETPLEQSVGQVLENLAGQLKAVECLEQRFSRQVNELMDRGRRSIQRDHDV